MPPDASGIAAYSAEVLPLLAARGLDVEVFGDRNCHEFVWKARRNSYDLTVFQLGNAACHDFMWAYLFRYPGLVVLHDAQVHQARALALTKRWRPRRDDYLAEFRANHPDAPPQLGEVVAAGFGESLYHHWPHIRLVVEAARHVAVHNRRLAADLHDGYPRAAFEAFAMGVADPLVEATVPPASSARAEGTVPSLHSVRARHGIPADAVVVGAFGGVTPEKRIGALLRALSATASRHPNLHLMLVGSAVAHYDVHEDARKWGVVDRVHVTGFVPDAALPHYLAAADLCACLRWPTNRETSASWLRCLAAGRATLVSDLADLGDVPSLDPRGWKRLDTTNPAREPIAISIDVVDEPHSLQLALDRLATDTSLRGRLGDAARGWWTAHHQLDRMADAYVRVMLQAMERPVPRIDLPAHLVDNASAHGRKIADSLGVSSLVRDVLAP
jgi:glycosyltransferase involved in cell wall biosynthesis